MDNAFTDFPDLRKWKKILTPRDLEMFGGQFVLCRNIPKHLVTHNLWLPPFSYCEGFGYLHSFVEPYEVGGDTDSMLSGSAVAIEMAFIETFTRQSIKISDIFSLDFDLELRIPANHELELIKAFYESGEMIFDSAGWINIPSFMKFESPKIIFLYRNTDSSFLVASEVVPTFANYASLTESEQGTPLDLVKRWRILRVSINEKDAYIFVESHGSLPREIHTPPYFLKLGRTWYQIPFYIGDAGGRSQIRDKESLRIIDAEQTAYSN